MSDVKKCGQRAFANHGFKLVVDGAEIEMVGFVQDIAAATILGMISQLKGVEDPKQVEISIQVGAKGA